MMKLVDMLGLGSSSCNLGIRVQVPFLVTNRNNIMPTINQLCKYKRSLKRLNSKSIALRSCPQKKGICVKIVTRTPKKPNSGMRKLVKLRLTSYEKRIMAYIPGEGHTLQEYSTVLMQGGKVKDLPGIKYRLIRGTLDLLGVTHRKTSRSKYGTKKK